MWTKALFQNLKKVEEAALYGLSGGTAADQLALNFTFYLVDVKC